MSNVRNIKCTAIALACRAYLVPMRPPTACRACNVHQPAIASIYRSNTCNYPYLALEVLEPAALVAGMVTGHPVLDERPA